MNYKQSISWLDSHNQFVIKLGIERIRKILNKLDKPQNNYKTIHVAGTNGKGSVCQYISSILQKAGYKTGLYTSPHLIDFSERIKVNNKCISKEELTKIIKKIRPIIEEIKNEKPTYFEITTAIAFEYFKQKKVDIGVIEVGLGGKYDATNIIKPMVSVITNVTLEHQNILGKTIEEIATQKAGIIKKETTVVTATKKTALNIIKKEALEKNSPLIIVSKKNWKRRFVSPQKQFFDIKTNHNNFEIETIILGEYQGENISICISAIEELQKQGMNITKKDIINGIKYVSNEARLEIIQSNPFIIIDGAHNVDAIKKLSKTITKDFNYNRIVLVFGILKDKNIKKILRILTPISDEIILTQPSINRSADGKYLESIVKKIDDNKKTIVIKNVEDAIKKSIILSSKKDLILITGSLHTAGEGLKYFKKI